MPHLENFSELEEEYSSQKNNMKDIFTYNMKSIIACVVGIIIVAGACGYLIGNAGNASAVASDKALIELGMSTSKLDHQFLNFAIRHEKSYATADEYERRKQIFKENLLFIQRENAKGNSYTLGETPFLDITNEEFKARNKLQLNADLPLADGLEEIIAKGLPPSIDWREKGVVTDVKNQGRCGSCWAFSTTGAVESANAINGSKLVSLSEEQLVSCATKNSGCNGGYMDVAFDYAENVGLTTEALYPYTSGNGSVSKCKHKKIAVQSNGFKMVKPKSDDHLLAALNKQPASIVVEANQPAFQFYVNGVIDGNCGDLPDHAVLAVGYGTTNKGVDYYLVKNSWGDKWGDDGYLKIARGPGPDKLGICGILTMAIIPSVPPP